MDLLGIVILFEFFLSCQIGSRVGFLGGNLPDFLLYI